MSRAAFSEARDLLLRPKTISGKIRRVELRRLAQAKAGDEFTDDDLRD